MLALKTKLYVSCAYCENPITKPPLLRIDQKFICKGCKPRITNKATVQEYETIQEFFDSPCRNKKQGCSSNMMKNLENHENHCVYNHITTCPITNCKWKGPSTHLVEHFRQSHPDNVHTKPVNHSLPQSGDNLDFRILTENGIHFLLKREFDKEADTYWLGIFYVEELKDSGKFHYTIEMKGEKSGKVIEIGQVNNEVLWNRKFKADRESLIKFEMKSVKAILEDRNILCKVLLKN